MKNQSIIIAIVVIILLAIGGYLFMNKTPSSQTTGTNTNAQVDDSAGGSGMMSLKDLMTGGKNQTCTFSSADENGTTSGTAYVSGGKVRTDFSGTYTDGKTYSGSMINDGTYVYSWTNDTNQGFKMAYTDSIQEAVEDVKQDVQNNPNKYVDPNKKVDYKCSSWGVDANVFVPPSNITFTDYSEMMKKVQDATQANPEMKAAQCQACDSAPEGEARTQCKKALGCN